MAKKHKKALSVSPIHFTMDEDATLLIKNSDLIAHANVESANQLNVVSITNPQGTLINNHNATWSFTPSKFFSGPIALDCIISDGTHKIVQKINIDVLHPAQPPANPEVELLIQEDGTFLMSAQQLILNATDIEGDNLEIVDMRAAQGIFTNNNDGTWSFIPNPEYMGTIELEFTVSDGKATVEQNLLITVNSPVIMPEIDYIMTENESVTFSGTDLIESSNDVEGDMLAVTEILPPERGQLINNDNGTWTYLPPANYIGPLQLQFGISDDRGAIVDQALTIYTITEKLKSLPTQVLPLEANGTVIITPETLLAYDPELVAMNVTIANVATTQGTITQLGATDNLLWIFTPNETFVDIIDLQYTVEDGGKKTSHTMSIEIESATDDFETE